MIDPGSSDYRQSPASPARPRFGYAPADSGAPPVVTILTPFYNSGSVFEETATSVFQQSLQQWEWLIVNDCSTDPVSLAMLARYRELDPRIRVIDLPANAGPSAARNAGYRAARSRYILQLDSDNLIEPTAAEKWFWFLESYPEFGFVKGWSVGFGAEEYLWQRGFPDGPAFLEQNLVDATSMVRRNVHEAAGVNDETIRGGFEDWDFWLRCANQGHWGGGVPEFLDWYRRRPSHSERWPDWDEGSRQEAFRQGLRQRYPGLWQGGFPRPAIHCDPPNSPVPDELPLDNSLRKSCPRLLLLAPWLTMGGSDRFNLNLVEWLISGGWEVTIATTLPGDHSWMPRFAQHTPDIFPLSHFLSRRDIPRFLHHLIRSRGIDVVLTSHSELGYMLLPYLRAHCPGVTFMDYCHIVEEYWRSGGYPRMSVEYQDLLDLSVVSSQHLAGWMTDQGADPARIAVCYTGADVDGWAPDPEVRHRVRTELGLDDHGPVLLFAGRLAEQKQPAVMVESLSRLRDRGVAFTALVAGDGPAMVEVRSTIAERGLALQVRLLGGQSPDRIRELMLAADLLFLPSRWEGIALTLYEAMACGVPVVSADVGGQRELVTPDCGVLLSGKGEHGSEADAYAAELERLLVDPATSRSMGTASRVRVEAYFTSNATRDRMLELVDQARRLHQQQPRPRPSLGVGRATAFQAIELLRLTQVADELWARRDPSSFRVRVYQRFARWFEPWYHWGLKRGWKWLARARNRLRVIVLRRS